jgi:hypothetical protein
LLLRRKNLSQLKQFVRLVQIPHVSTLQAFPVPTVQIFVDVHVALATRAALQEQH